MKPTRKSAAGRMNASYIDESIAMFLFSSQYRQAACSGSPVSSICSMGSGCQVLPRSPAGVYLCRKKPFRSMMRAKNR
ncbi:MAG: hypothetical protein A4E28_01965 [Methanocella sp. PtaU1.Bin125]|nr:MAG: hypothetical protein A4E28_01965 [Methanocella sp. PtaU1.Bin125]